ncbi:MAG TPA: hypothetical protein ENJ45_04250 [Phaeodactylibacter sp.]|nr:hypothetical protein [Phaeodactylibacter sp.]
MDSTDKVDHKKFLLSLLSLTGILSLLAFLCGFHPRTVPLQNIFIISIVFFFFFSLFSYWMGVNAAFSHNKFAFTRVTFIFLFGKLFLSIALLIAYKKIVEPESNLFVLPFFLVYICYTVFETGFMMRLGRINHQSNKL